MEDEADAFAEHSYFRPAKFALELRRFDLRQLANLKIC